MRQNERTSAEAVTAQLRGMILSGELPPGAPLRQDRLSEALSVSRTPLRQALQMLSDEGLVVASGFKGARVVEITQEIVEDLFDMRLALEPLALASAIPKMTKVDFALAEMAIDKAAAATSDAEQCALNWEFHYALYQPSGRALLVDTIKRLNLTATFASVIGRSVSRRLSDSDAEHIELLDLCKRRQVEGALDLLQAHLRAAKEVLMTSFPIPNQ